MNRRSVTAISAIIQLECSIDSVSFAIWLGLSLTATEPIPRGNEYDPARRDYAQTFTRLLAERDFEFAIKMLADYATASLQAGRPLLLRSPRLKDPHWSAALAGITNYTAHRLSQPSPAWTRRISLSRAFLSASTRASSQPSSGAIASPSSSPASRS